MKKSILWIGIAAAVGIASPSVSATTVVVDEGRVTVDQGQPVVIDPVGAKSVVIKKTPAILEVVKDPRALEGEIIQVDYPSYTVTVRDIDGRERRILLKRGMISNYKVDDYVVMRLTPDLQEAMKIRTRHTADIEGDVVQIDRAAGVLVVREPAGIERTVHARTDVLSGYKVGDHVRLYIVLNDANYQEAKIIRVR